MNQGTTTAPIKPTLLKMANQEDCNKKITIADVELSLNELIPNCNWGDTISFTDQPKPFSQGAVRHLFIKTIEHMVEVMNIATGVAQIKGKYYVGQDEIDQASTIKNEGTTKFLPEV